MRNLLTALAILLAFRGFSQIVFESSALPTNHLNSSNGKKYLILDPHSDLMAFTEEREGHDGENQIEEVTLGPSKVYLLKDWLETKGLVSPIGFFENKFYYNHIIHSAGTYFGIVMQFSMEDGSSEPIRIPQFRSKSRFQNGCLSKDGQYMILSLETDRSDNMEDLYVIKRKADGTWSSPIDLGPMINTSHQEITPFLAPDNRTLYFATDGRDGHGSFDIYYSRRLDSSWKRWNKPVNLGERVNTSGAETAFSYRKDTHAYFLRSNEYKSQGKVYQIKIKEITKADTLKNAIVLQIVDETTKKSISATLIHGDQIRAQANGLFMIDTLSNQEVEIKAKGYLPKIIRLDQSLKVGRNMVPLTSITKGKTIPLNKVLFARGTAKLIEGSEKELDLVVDMMNDNANIKILLKGHTDNVGYAEKNLQLSEARVGTVKEYIITKGISSDRVTGKGFGGTQPIASNENEYTRKHNRRVEFEVTAN